MGITCCSSSFRQSMRSATLLPSTG
jgi:hypothetical protein